MLQYCVNHPAARLAGCSMAMAASFMHVQSNASALALPSTKHSLPDLCLLCTLCFFAVHVVGVPRMTCIGIRQAPVRLLQVCVSCLWSIKHSVWALLCRLYPGHLHSLSKAERACDTGPTQARHSHIHCGGRAAGYRVLRL